MAAYALTLVPEIPHTEITRAHLPQRLGSGSGMTWWRRLAASNEAGMRDQPHAVLLKKLRSAKHQDRSRMVINSFHLQVINSFHLQAARRDPQGETFASPRGGSLP
ncbi:hypothetical protein C3492_13275 [Streptomyces sp. Ru62]|nr:hypothetical protein C3492_13275 [Streptomyces sp. Ru62]